MRTAPETGGFGRNEMDFNQENLIEIEKGYIKGLINHKSGVEEMKEKVVRKWRVRMRIYIGSRCNF